MTVVSRRNRVEFGDFQTPPALADAVCRHTYQTSFQQPRTIIEPTCGQGSFLEAATKVFGPDVEYFGFDVNPDYVEDARRRLEKCNCTAKVEIREQDFFGFDWKSFLQTVAQPVLFLGNPPWVTNTALGTISADNLPAKTNIKQLNGLDALTGKANFDISEWMLLKLMEAIGNANYSMAILCKTAVARKVLEYKWRHSDLFPQSELHQIDALTWFGAAVDACLFSVGAVTQERHDLTAPLYRSLDSVSPISRFGLFDGHFVSDVDEYREVRHLSGINYYRWRSGVKHDLARIMEFDLVDGRLRNGLGECVDIEDEFVFPLLKATEVSKGISIPSRRVLITQTTPGEDTEKLRDSAPKTWQYLITHDALFAARKSSIYRNQPKYALFGLGPYSFAPFKVAVSGLHKTLRFTLVPPFDDKPVFFDDTCYLIGTSSLSEASLVCDLLNANITLRFFAANIFTESKRPVTSAILNHLDIKKVAERLGKDGELIPFLQGGSVGSHGQGALVFEEASAYASRRLDDII